MRWKPKHNGDFMNGKPSHKRWDYDYGLSHLGHDTCENMTMSPFTTPTQSPKPFGKEMMHGQQLRSERFVYCISAATLYCFVVYQAQLLA